MRRTFQAPGPKAKENPKEVKMVAGEVMAYFMSQNYQVKSCFHPPTHPVQHLVQTAFFCPPPPPPPPLPSQSLIPTAFFSSPTHPPTHPTLSIGR